MRLFVCIKAHLDLPISDNTATAAHALYIVERQFFIVKNYIHNFMFQPYPARLLSCLTVNSGILDSSAEYLLSPSMPLSLSSLFRRRRV